MSVVRCHSEECSDEESLGSLGSHEILRGVYPEFIEGLRMTMYDFWMDAACCDLFVTQ